MLSQEENHLKVHAFVELNFPYVFAGGIWQDRFHDNKYHIKAKEEARAWSDEGAWSEDQKAKFP